MDEELSYGNSQDNAFGYANESRSINILTNWKTILWRYKK